MVTPYLPNIIKDCVTKVDTHFNTRSTDKFNVFFEKGILSQVRKSVFENENNFPLVWFVMKYDEQFGKENIYSSATFQLLICVKTNVDYTQEQREENSYFNRLIPIQEKIIEEIKNNNSFHLLNKEKLKYRITYLPYWGLGDVNGQANQPNLFANEYVDALSINFSDVEIENVIHCPKLLSNI